MRLKIILILIITLTLTKGQNFPDRMPEIIIKYLGKERIEEYKKEAPDKLQLWLFGVYESYGVEGLTHEQEIAFRDTFDIIQINTMRKEKEDIKIPVGNKDVILYSYEKLEQIARDKYPRLSNYLSHIRKNYIVPEPKTKTIKQ